MFLPQRFLAAGHKTGYKTYVSPPSYYLRKQPLKISFTSILYISGAVNRSLLIDEHTVVTTGEDTSPKASEMSFDEQIEALKKLKELTDAGILTQEEFELKKKEILEL